MAATSQVLSVRVSAAERDLLEAAARDARTSLSEFVRRKAVEAAEIDVMDRRVIIIPVADWERFEAWAFGPAKDVPALKELAAFRPEWKR